MGTLGCTCWLILLDSRGHLIYTQKAKQGQWYGCKYPFPSYPCHTCMLTLFSCFQSIEWEVALICFSQILTTWNILSPVVFVFVFFCHCSLPGCGRVFQLIIKSYFVFSTNTLPGLHVQPFLWFTGIFWLIPGQQNRSRDSMLFHCCMGPQNLSDCDPPLLPLSVHEILEKGRATIQQVLGSENNYLNGYLLSRKICCSLHGSDAWTCYYIMKI